VNVTKDLFVILNNMKSEILCCYPIKDAMCIRWYDPLKGLMTERKYDSAYLRSITFNNDTSFKQGSLDLANSSKSKFLTSTLPDRDCDHCNHRFKCWTEDVETR
jgi:hypothetical protein